MHLFKRWHKIHQEEPFQKLTFCGKFVTSFTHTVHPWPTGADTFTPGTVCDECEEEYTLYLLWASSET